MNSKYLWRVALIGILGAALATNAQADTLKSTVNRDLAIAIVGVAAVVVVVVVVVHQSTKKRTITGCVTTRPDGMAVTDEKDKRVYTLSGDTAGVKPGERMTLQGKKLNANANHTLTWETKRITKDFGVCQP